MARIETNNQKILNKIPPTPLCVPTPSLNGVGFSFIEIKNG